MKPFLLLQIRPEDEASDDEYQSIIEATGLDETTLKRWRLERRGTPKIVLDDYSGIIIGGGPADVSTPHHEQSDEQKLYESDLKELLQKIVDEDYPCLGICYGSSLIAHQQGSELSKDFAESVGPVSVNLTDAGKQDRLLKGVPSQFTALTGHHEGVARLSSNAVLLASASACPVEIFRYGNNVYCIQFHPEAVARNWEVRIRLYFNHGYFEPHEADELIRAAYAADVRWPRHILRNFAQVYKVSA